MVLLRSVLLFQLERQKHSQCRPLIPTLLVLLLMVLLQSLSLLLAACPEMLKLFAVELFQHLLPRLNVLVGYGPLAWVVEIAVVRTQNCILVGLAAHRVAMLKTNVSAMKIAATSPAWIWGLFLEDVPLMAAFALFPFPKVDSVL